MSRHSREVAWVPAESAPDRRSLLSREARRRYAAGYTRGYKLTPQDVVAIRELWAAGVSQRRIAASYGLSQPTVCSIVRRDTWASIPASDRERTLLCAHETAEPSDGYVPTTGRLQVRGDDGAWVTVGDMRACERLSGIERETLASLAHAGVVLRWEPWSDLLSLA